MQLITSITSKSKQRLTLVLENNETVDFFLFYSPRQECWFFDFTYKDLTVNGLSVVITPNALRQFRNQIPFGIAFAANSFVEPFSIDDFSSGRVNMFVLNQDEVEQAELEIYNA